MCLIYQFWMKLVPERRFTLINLSPMWPCWYLCPKLATLPRLVFVPLNRVRNGCSGVHQFQPTNPQRSFSQTINWMNSSTKLLIPLMVLFFACWNPGSLAKVSRPNRCLVQCIRFWACRCAAKAWPAAIFECVFTREYSG